MALINGWRGTGITWTYLLPQYTYFMERRIVRLSRKFCPELYHSQVILLSSCIRLCKYKWLVPHWPYEKVNLISEDIQLIRVRDMVRMVHGSFWSARVTASVTFALGSDETDCVLSGLLVHWVQASYRVNHLIGETSCWLRFVMIRRYPTWAILPRIL